MANAADLALPGRIGWSLILNGHISGGVTFTTVGRFHIPSRAIIDQGINDDVV